MRRRHASTSRRILALTRGHGMGTELDRGRACVLSGKPDSARAGLLRRVLDPRAAC